MSYRPVPRKGMLLNCEEALLVSKKQKKTIPLRTENSPYIKGARFLVIPADLNQSFTPCSAEITALHGYQGWLQSSVDAIPFPEDEELLLIEFKDHYVITHRTRVVLRQDGKVLVAAPSLSEQEESQLAPSTGRHDYRVKVDVPIQIRLRQEQPGTPLNLGRLADLSRGGMSFVANPLVTYREGDEVNLQVVSWEYPVNIDAVVSRISTHEDKQLVAVRFIDEMTLRQREMVSAFILQVQRKDALARSLPSENNE